VCDRADESILETAAVSVTPVNGGPEQLVIFVVLKKGFNTEPDKLKGIFSRVIQSNLNPLFKVRLSGYSTHFPKVNVPWWFPQNGLYVMLFYFCRLLSY
jgi:hypothetical protein